MTVDDRLLYETRVRPRQAVVAGLAGTMLVVAAIIQLSGPHTTIDELTLDLITAHRRFPLDVVGAVINALGALALAGTLAFLVSTARARNPKTQPFIRILAILGGVAAAITGVAYAVVIAVKADQFVSAGSQTYEQANHLTSTSAILVLQLIGQAAALVLAVGFVLTSMSAMRVGLLTRFMGYLGIFAGVLVLFPIGSPVPVVQGFWLLALGYMLSGRWPTGVPTSWRSGRAEKWPSSQELREQRAAKAGGRRAGASNGSERGKPAPSPAPEAVSAPPTRARTNTPKRKRKRRR
ncbi:MAG: hypothetical protein ACR2OB_09630 [Solirubrobacteraceae bacterium]